MVAGSGTLDAGTGERFETSIYSGAACNVPGANWASLPPRGSSGGQNNAISQEAFHQNILCFCFCIKKMFLLPLSASTLLCDTTTDGRSYPVCVSFVNSCPVGTHKAQTAQVCLSLWCLLVA